MREIIIILSILLFSISCHQKSDAILESEMIEELGDIDRSISVTKSQFESSNYQLQRMSQKEVMDVLPAYGEIHLPDKNRYAVSSHISGIVSNMYLIKGDYVRKGQLLFNLTNPELISWQEELLETKGKLVYLKDESDRQEAISKANISAYKTYVKALSDYNVAEAKKAGLEAKLKLVGISPDQVSLTNLNSTLSVYAPISGYVSEIGVYNGVSMIASHPALTIDDTRHMHLELRVMEKDAGKIKLEQKVFFKLNDSDDPIVGAIHIIEKSIDQDRMLGMHCHLEKDNNPALIAGMNIKASIVLGRRMVYALPIETLVTIQKEEFVLVRESTSDYSFKERKVVVGEKFDGYFEILNIADFKESDEFLTKGAFDIVTNE
jgi:cobalt-zinc-cadmium efflux system membrane fusion protein